MSNVIKLHPKDAEVLQEAINAPPQPNEALRRLLRNESILGQVRGIPMQPGTSETDADPRNPNVR